MEEVWKYIIGTDNIYSVSNFGSIRNNIKQMIVKPFDNKGYERVYLSRNGKSMKKLVHIIVAEHFISEKPFDGAQVNHKDLNRKNNHVNNLEWSNGSENVKHAIQNRNGRSDYLKEKMSNIGQKYGHIGIEASKKSVEQIDSTSGEILAIFESAREAAKKTGANYKNISDVCTGKKKTHMGYFWRFHHNKSQTTIEITS